MGEEWRGEEFKLDSGGLDWGGGFGEGKKFGFL